jgi:hypothetical protein
MAARAASLPFWHKKTAPGFTLERPFLTTTTKEY